MRKVRGGWLLLIAGLLYGWAAGSELLPLGGQLTLQTGETRSTLDRETGRVTTSAVLRADNTGDRPLLAPLHLVMRPADGGAGFAVDGALGGPDDARYGAHYFDLSDTVGDGLQPGQGIELPFSYSRPAGSGGYALEAYGLFNQDPVARILAPQAIVAGEAVVFDGTGSFDPEGEPLTYAWEFGDDAGPSDPVAEFAFDLPGTYTIRLRVVDRQGAVDEVFRTVVVVPPGSFSLAQVRTLDASGQPLGGVAVEDLGESPGPAGLSSGEGGIFVGAGEPGTRVWKFSLPGRLPVWREIAFVDRGVVLAPSPWLAPAGQRQASVSPLEAAAIGGASERARLEFPAGAFSQPGQLGLTALSGNSLPLPLPRGWTPLAAFHYSFPGELVEPGAATWLPPVAPRAGDLLAVARFDPDELEWQVLQVLDGPALAQTDLTRDGWFVLALADAQPASPPAPLAGAALPAAPVGDEPVVLSAEGIVDPAQRVASLDPERVTARAEVTFAGAAGLASGRFFRAEISERYSLADGRVLRTPDYDTTFFAYRGLPERDPDTLVADFPLRPALLFDSTELAEARIVATVLDPETFAGTVLDPLGGQLSAGAVTLRIPAGAFADRTVGELREISSEGFLALLGGLVPVAAFQLNAPAALGELEVALAGLAPDADYILARLITPAGRPALEPVLRMRSDANGTARSTEPASGPRLPGVGAGGRYVLVAVDARPGLLAGTASALDGAPVPGLVAAVVGQPWQTFSRAGGAFVSVAPVGTWTAEAVDPADANRGTADFELLSGTDVAEVEIRILPTGPRVIATVPVAGAANVRTVTPVAVTFSEPLDPLSFGPEALELVDPDGALVPGSLGLNGAATEATYLPVNPLLPATDYRILLATTIRDRSGLPIEGELEFAFRTAAPAARGIGAELVIYEPGALNVPEEVLSRLVGYAAGAGSSHVVATGGPGTADPEVPVILVNNASGATATVLSRPDGSFATFIDAGEEDFVEAVFINANDTRVTIPATRQLFDDGRIGLYRYGGILEAESDGGPVEVFVEPEAIEERVRFELKALDLNAVLEALEGNEATEGQVLGAVRLAHDADKELSVPVDISFPLDRSTLQLPEGIESAEEATFVLTRAVETVDGEIVYEILDTMQVEGDRLVTRSPPYPGILMQTITTALQTRTSSFRRPGNSNLLLRAMGLPGVQETVVHQLLLPFMMVVGGTTTDIIGTVKSVRVDASGDPLGEPQPVLGASVSFSPPPFAPAGRFRPGMFVVSSREPNGFFAFRADITLEGSGYLLRATHPRFPNQVALKAGQIGNLSQRFLEFDIRVEDLLFIIPPPSTEGLGADVSAPRIRASHAPFLPLAGMDGADAGAQLLLIAEDDREVVDLRAVLLEGRRANGLLFEPAEVRVDFNEVLLESTQRLEHAYRVNSAHAGRVLVEISATDSSGNLTTIVHAIDFGRQPLVAPSPDGDSQLGPRVTSAWPPEGSVNHAPFPEIWLNFSRPLPPEAFVPANSDWITFSSQHTVVSVVPSADRREARIRISGAGTGEVAMQIGSPLTDEQGRPFDQDPGEQGEQAFNLRFSLATRSIADLDIERGGGVVGAGARLFSLERGQTGSPALVCFDVSDPSAPVRIGSLGLPANPSDLTYIPAYPLQARLDQPPVQRDLVVVIGGTNGAGPPGTATATFKWMWVIDVTDAANPFRLASGNISQDPISLVAKVLADPPLITYLTLSADVTSLHVVDLAAFVIGHNATPGQRAAFPEMHTPGIDLNGDGDFNDPGEQVSLPARNPATYYGEFFSFAPFNPRERLVDFATGPNGGLFAIAYNLDTRATRFLNVLASIGELDDERGSLLLPDSDGKRVATFGAVPMVLDGQPRLLDLALISLRAGEASGPSLAVIDISQPLVPSLLGYVRLPDDAGIPQSIILRADGTLALAMTSDLLILDPSRLLEVDAAGNSLAILQRIPGLGSGARSYVAAADGLNALALGNRSSITFTGPQFSVITFNRSPETATEIAALGESEKLQLLSGAIPSAILRRAALSFSDSAPDAGGAPAQPVPSAPLPADHYYLLVRAPGGAGATLPLLLASVDRTGKLPAPSDGTALPSLILDPATHAALLDTAAEQGSEMAFPVSLDAHRLSSDSGNPFFNLYLAGPFTLHGSLAPEQASALTAQLPRAFLKANRRVVVGLPPAGGAAFLDPFRAVLREGQVIPGSSAILPTDFRRNPLVFVPGVMASRLVETGTFVSPTESGLLLDLWINPTRALGDLFDSLGKLELNADGTGDSSIGAVDAIRKLSGFIDIQGGFLTYLRDELGYREYLPAPPPGTDPFTFRYNLNPGRFAADESPDYDSLAQLPDLFVFPYDWRKDNRVNAERLAMYVDLILTAQPDADAVDIVAHSMGGMVSRRFMLASPGKVDRLITIASPFLGAPKAVYTMYTGDMDDWGLNFVTPLESSRRIARNMPALHQLLPNRGYFDLGGRPLSESSWDLDGDGTIAGAYSYDQYKKVLDNRLFTDGEQPAPLPVSANETFHLDPSFAPGDNTFDWSRDSSGARIYHIVALQQVPRTIDRIQLETSLRVDLTARDIGLTLPSLDFVDSEQIGASRALLPEGDLALNPFENRAYRVGTRLRPLRGAGDGTVPLLSATRAFGQRGVSLNAPGTVMIPIIARFASEEQNEAASHVGVLNNPDLHRLIGRILLNDITPAEQPVLSITFDAQVNEGSPARFSVRISNKPAGADEPPVIVWDTGDGRLIVSAENREEEHIYIQDGDYTLTCSVWFPGLDGTVASRTVRVVDVPPQISLRVVPESPHEGELFRVIADVIDPGSDDRYAFDWARDGEPVGGIPNSASFLEESVFQAGSYTYEVRVDAGSGEPVEASLTVSVAAPSAAGPPDASPTSVTEIMWPQESTDEPVNTRTVDRVEMMITGHKVESVGSLDARHDNSPLMAYRIVFDGRPKAMTREVLGDRQESIKLYRYYPDDRPEIPQFSTLEVIAETPRVVIELSFLPSAGGQRCFRWEIPTEPGDRVRLQIPWDDFAALSALERSLLVSPADNEHQEVSCIQGGEPTIVHRIDARTGALTLGSIDRDPTLEGDPVDDLETLENLEPVGFLIGDPGDDPCAVEKNSMVLVTRGPAFHRGAVPHDATALMTVDSRGQAVPASAAPPPKQPNAELNETVAEEIRNAVRTAFRLGASTELFQKFAIDLGDLLILEQGTGAGLWKEPLEKIVGAYVPGKSDNDYEIFLPVFKSLWNGINFAEIALDDDPEVPESIERGERSFRTFAHTREFMLGDWYFAYPHGMHGNRNLGPVPYFEDRQELADYLAGVTHWRYYLPEGVQTTLNAAVLPSERPPTATETPLHYFDIPKGAIFFGERKSIFNYPVTPAEILSFALTERLKSEQGLRKILPDISFFPFRREHFLFGILSLERPPPFGDDSIGDAGMGRSLLLLKWVLEGAFLPQFAGPTISGEETAFNLFMDASFDLELRSRVFNRLKDRREELALEGYEWGIYQEFAALIESVTLRLQRADITADCLQQLGDFIQAHDIKSLKKVGKAAIRGALARVAADDGARETIFELDPAAYQADMELKSFEHLIARLAKRHITLFPGFSAPDIDGFLRAKLGDKSFAGEIARDGDRFDAFVTRGFELLRTRVQQPSLAAYSAGLLKAQQEARVNEWLTRTQNAIAIDYGLTTAQGGSRPGRRAMHGVDAGHAFTYTLAASLRRVGDMPNGPYTLTLTGNPDGEVEYGPLTFGADDTILYVDGKPLDDSGPALAVSRVPGEESVLSHNLSVSVGDDDIDSNNIVRTRSYLLPTEGVFDANISANRDRTVLFRGLRLGPEDGELLRGFIENELEVGLLRASSIRNGESFERGLERNVKIATHLFNTQPVVSGFTPEDFALLEEEQKAVIAHVQPPPNSEILVPFAMGAVGDLLQVEVNATGWKLNDQTLQAFNPQNDNVVGTFRLLDILSDSLLLLQVVDAASNVAPGTLIPAKFLFRAAVGEFGISTATRVQDALLFGSAGEGTPYLLALEVQRDHGGYKYLPISVMGTGEDAKPVQRLVNPKEGDEVVFLGEMPFLRVHLYRIDDDPVSIIPDFNSPILRWLGTYEPTANP